MLICYLFTDTNILSIDSKSFFMVINLCIFYVTFYVFIVIMKINIFLILLLEGQRGLSDYERHKEDQRIKNVSYHGTTGE